MNNSNIFRLEKIGKHKNKTLVAIILIHILDKVDKFNFLNFVIDFNDRSHFQYKGKHFRRKMIEFLFVLSSKEDKRVSQLQSPSL